MLKKIFIDDSSGGSYLAVMTRREIAPTQQKRTAMRNNRTGGVAAQIFLMTTVMTAAGVALFAVVDFATRGIIA